MSLLKIPCMHCKKMFALKIIFYNFIFYELLKYPCVDTNHKLSTLTNYNTTLVVFDNCKWSSWFPSTANSD